MLGSDRQQLRPHLPPDRTKNGDPTRPVTATKATAPTPRARSTTSRIDAAILAINHSFIVDNYDCGDSLGTLTVHGAIAQKYRGAVGTSGAGGTGYLKDYNYDDRLHYIQPPSFIEPVQSDWVIGRETVG